MKLFPYTMLFPPRRSLPKGTATISRPTLILQSIKVLFFYFSPRRSLPKGTATISRLTLILQSIKVLFFSYFKFLLIILITPLKSFFRVANFIFIASANSLLLIPIKLVTGKLFCNKYISPNNLAILPL